MRICNKCKKNKPLNKYFKDKSKKGGYRARCKACESKRAKGFYDKNKENILKKAKAYRDSNKAEMIEYQREYRRSKDNKLKALYNNQIVNSERRGHPKPNYTFNEFKSWAIDNDFHILFKVWEDKKFDKYFAPSGDRLDSSQPYTLDNLQLVTWKENEDNYKDEFLSECSEKISFRIEYNILIISDWNDDIDFSLSCIRYKIDTLPNIIIYKGSDEEWFKVKVSESGFFIAFEPLEPSLVDSVYSEDTALKYVLKGIVSFL